ncbi:MAG TPA: DUF1501 domain-containing protein [Blastocatellia bacterium]|nr:DUF1501 domain-containing protein [Blastocatellia bacterium]
MATTRREFIKRSAGAVTVSLFLPQLFVRGAAAQGANNRKLVKIFLLGGNDGLNTVVPYTDMRYYQLRPVIAIKEADLKDSQNQTTIISDQFGLHPSLSPLKALYDNGKVAIVAGVGSAKPNLSHFDMMDQWHTGDPTKTKRDGWLGRYLNIKYGGGAAIIPAVSLKTFFAPRTFRSTVDAPSITNFTDYGLRADPIYPAEQPEVVRILDRAYTRGASVEGLTGEFSRIAEHALGSIQKIKTIPDRYTSTVTYPAASSLSDALKMVAQTMVGLPEASLFYVEVGGYDTHARQIDGTNPVTGFHATLLSQFSQAVSAFYSDLAQHNVADDVLIMTVSDFGRQVPQNASNGTDHGTAGPMFIIGNPVHGGIYGEQPSLAVGKLDSAGNMAVTVDFRAVYSNILERWLGVDPALILDKRFDDLGFLA